jgi:hypothetical protein
MDTKKDKGESMSIHIGFTGTRDGLTRYQRVRLDEALEDYIGRAEEIDQQVVFHHGDCLGADAQAHGVAMRANISVIIHPPDDTKLRAFCAGATWVCPEAPYLNRNKDIVDSTSILVATPKGPETTRSGTWSTIRYAMKKGKEIIIIPPMKGDDL